MSVAKAVLPSTTEPWPGELSTEPGSDLAQPTITQDASSRTGRKLNESKGVALMGDVTLFVVLRVVENIPNVAGSTNSRVAVNPYVEPVVPVENEGPAEVLAQREVERIRWDAWMTLRAYVYARVQAMSGHPVVEEKLVCDCDVVPLVSLRRPRFPFQPHESLSPVLPIRQFIGGNSVANSKCVCPSWVVCRVACV